MTADHPSTWVDGAGPFKFLDYFKEADEAGFAGRDHDVQSALAGVLRAPSFVLYGGSGTGKTSLLYAGLFPQLRRQGLRPVYARTLVDPLADLRRAILGELEDDLPEAGSAAELPDLLARLSSEKPVVLVLDQFEEFFIRFRDQPERREPFIAALGRIAADPSLAVKLLFSLRQEYLGELDDFRQHLPQLFDNEYRLKPLTAFGARQSIASQLRNARVPFERRFLTRVVDLLEKDNFDPTILQIVCSEVYNQASKAGRETLRLTVADVEKVGDVGLLFRRYLNLMAASLRKEDRLTARAVLHTLISGERTTRRAATFEAIHQESARADEATVRRVLKSLEIFRLVRPDEQGEESWYELAHERLATVVHEWLELDEDFRQLRTARQLIASMARGEHWRHEPGLLLTAHQLERAVAPVREHLPVTPTEVEFLVRSAIFRRSRDPGKYWIGRHGAEDSRRVALEMLASDDSEVVWGAARMARHVVDSGGELARACARKAALEDNLEIAAEAYFSVLALTRGVEHKKLMREAVAEVVTEAERPNPLSRLVRRARRGRVLARARKQAAWQSMSESYRGLKTRVMDSMAATLLWAILIGPAIYLAGAWPTGRLELFSAEALAKARGWGIPALLLLAVALATTLPATVGRALGRVRPSWSRIVLCAWVLPWDLAWLVLLVVSVLGIIGGSLFLGPILGCAGALAWFVVAAGLLIATSTLVTVNGKALRADASEVEIWGWSLLTSCGLPILAPSLLLFGPAYLGALAGWLDLDLMAAAAAVTVAVAMALSFLCFIFQLLLARSGLPPFRREVTAPRRRRARRVAVATIGLNLLFFGSGGYDTVPFLSPRLAVGESGQVEHRNRLGPGFPDVDYLRLSADGDATSGPRLLRLLEPPSVPTHLAGLDLREAPPDHVLALPGARAAGDRTATGWWSWLVNLSARDATVHRLIVGPVSTFGWSSMLQEWQLSLEVLDGPLELTTEWSYATVDLTRPVQGSAEDRVWSHTLATGVSAPPPGSVVEIVVFRNQPTAAAAGFSGKIKIVPTGEEDKQNCNFVPRPVLNAPPEPEGKSRGTWKVPAEHWPEARILLDRVGDRDRLTVPLVIGARLQ